MEARITVTGIKDVDELVDVIKKLDSNTTIECKLETKKKQEVETESIFHDMSFQELTRYMRLWMSQHLKDTDITISALERAFNTPVQIYMREVERANEQNSGRCDNGELPKEASPDNKAAIEKHLMRKEKQMAFDEKGLKITRIGTDG